ADQVKVGAHGAGVHLLAHGIQAEQQRRRAGHQRKAAGVVPGGLRQESDQLHQRPHRRQRRHGVRRGRAHQPRQPKGQRFPVERRGDQQQNQHHDQQRRRGGGRRAGGGLGRGKAGGQHGRHGQQAAG